ncbi:MAG: C45 family autoproteolytic acyltransferase/hydrolase [Desulfovibrio sp.]|jgi:isopenicillin-N N-acyltransferase-like protein|nr:C45 family autoproteolytic acyltransferase/hydrolase [Desulfovibrio sp.]
MKTTLPVLDLAGSPTERGLAHGRAMKDAIHDFLAGITAVHQANNSLLNVNRERLARFCMRNLGYLEKTSPDLCAEMRAIAEGAELTFEDILYLNSFLELEDLRAPQLGGRMLPDGPWGCTTFNVTAAAGAGGRAYLGQTFDMEKYYERFLCILRIRPEKEPDQIIVSMAGVLGLAGLNNRGIGLVINKLVATDARPGIIYPFIVRKVLSAERIGDALGSVIFTRRATGMNYQISGEGAAFCAETSAERYELLDIKGSLAHTNHWLGATTRVFETPGWLSHGGSMVRRLTAQTFLDEREGNVTMDHLKEMTRNHVNHPRCICAHGFPGEDETTAFHTIFAVIMEPAAGRLEICPGNPCVGAYDVCTFDGA